MNETTNPEAIVTTKYRTDLKMTYRAFTDALNEHLVNTGVTYQTVMNWEKGMTEPSTDFLLICMVVYSPRDWQYHYAKDMLIAKLPEVFAPDGNGGLRILSSSIS